MKLISKLNAFHYILIYIGISFIQSIVEAIYVDENFSIETIEDLLPYLSFYLAVAFLIKLRYYWTSIVFLIPIYFETKKIIFTPYPTRIKNIDFQTITQISFIPLYVMICIKIFFEWKRKDLADTNKN